MILDPHDSTFIILRCKDCEYIECPIVPNGYYWRGKEGCTRQVNEEDAARFIHYSEEVIPFWKTYSPRQLRESYDEIIHFLYNNIYIAPFGQRLGADGKVKINR